MIIAAGMKTLSSLAAILALGAPTSVLAQSKAEAIAVKAVQIAAARKANAALMRQYTWRSRIELIENGSVKDTRMSTWCGTRLYHSRRVIITKSSA